MGDIMVRFITGMCIGIEFYGRGEIPFVKWAVGIDIFIIRIVISFYDQEEMLRAFEEYKKQKGLKL